MRVVAVLGLLLTLGVLAVPLPHGTPSERPAFDPTPAVGRGPTGNPGLAGRSLGVSLAADRETIPADTGLYRGRSAERWAQLQQRDHASMVKRGRTIARLRRTLAYNGSVNEALSLAATVYGHGSELRRKAWCESRFNPRALNPSGAAGLLQFIPSTWRTTPYGRFSIWSPYANALAAGWMLEHGRGAEWTCR